MTLYIGMSRPDIFGKLAVMSPSIWWDHGAILQIVHDLLKRRSQSNAGWPRPRIWLDMGTEEGARPHHMVRDARMLRDLFVKRGWQQGEDLIYCEDQGAGHNESAWANRMSPMLKFLFGTA